MFHRPSNGLVWTEDVLVGIDFLLKFVLLPSHLFKLVLLLNDEFVQVSVDVSIILGSDVPNTMAILNSCNLTSFILLQRSLVLRLVARVLRPLAQIAELLGDATAAVWGFLVHSQQVLCLAGLVELYLYFNQVLTV